jgi:hypothetical protein
MLENEYYLKEVGNKHLGCQCRRKKFKKQTQDTFPVIGSFRGEG